MSKPNEILPLFSKLDSHAAINQLVEKAYKVALAYLRFNNKKISKVFSDGEVTFESAAISAITPLFISDSEDKVLPILKEFNSWQPPIKTENDALFFLNKVIGGRVDQHISSVLKEQDPFFSKILDSINHLVRKDGFKKLSYFGKRFIVHSSCKELNNNTIDLEDFQNIPAGIFRNRKTILTDLMSYIERETNFFPAIPLNSLVLRLRNLNMSTFKPQTAENGALANFDADELVGFGLSFTLKKLEESYYNKAKLSTREYEYFKKTLISIAGDLKDGGLHHGLFDYLSHQMQGLDKQTYLDKYHNILEYLVKVMKQTIREKMEKNEE